MTKFKYAMVVTVPLLDIISVQFIEFIWEFFSGYFNFPFIVCSDQIQKRSSSSKKYPTYCVLGPGGSLIIIL